MSTTAVHAHGPSLDSEVVKHDTAALTRMFQAQDEFIAIDALPALAPHVHRNFIPRHKKGGSISRFDLERFAPAFAAVYQAPALLEFLRRLTGQVLGCCPTGDPHACALYYYTEAGDHIGFHYDTSYYRGARYTVLLGLVDDSSCRLEYELYRRLPGRETAAGSLALAPGTLVVFNGDKLWHRITPSAAGERRIALTLEYVTSVDMHPLWRFVSNMKDAIAYFGFRQVFARTPRR